MEDGRTYELEVHLSGLTARELRVQVPGESIRNISVQEEVGSVGRVALRTRQCFFLKKVSYQLKED
jgi:hypothetical protein